jgi:hypothetical protein
MQFQQDFYHIERKEHRDKNLWHFFFAIFAIFVVKLSWLRRDVPGFLRLFAANQFKLLPMNNLRSKRRFPSQGQSRLIKANQGKLR